MTTDISPENVARMLEGVTLAISSSGYGVIYIAPVENEVTAVAIPTRDKDMGWRKANPEVYEEMVRRFNEYPALSARLAEVKAERDTAEKRNKANSRMAEYQFARAEAAEAELAKLKKDFPNGI